MKVKLKEDPREWRKSTLLTLLALAMLSSVLCWRRVLPLSAWRVALILLATLAVLAWLSPRLFRGYYRISTRAGFWLSQIIAQVVLALIFVFFLTPLGLVFRAFGKDPLRLKRPQNVSTYWTSGKKSSPLDQMF
jgi:hypothetical protein